MTRALILAGREASALQLLYARYRLREDGIVVDVAAPEEAPIRLDSEVTWTAVTPFESLEEPADIAIFVAGTDRSTYRESLPLEWLRSHHDRRGIVATLGRAVPVLGHLGLIDGRRVTAPSDLRDEIHDFGGTWTGEAVSIDGTIVTGRGTSDLPRFMAAVRSDHAIPQDDTAVIGSRHPDA